MWRQADKYHVPRIAYVNKMDIIGADFLGCVEQMKTRLGAKAVPIQLPIGAEDTFQGMIDLVEMKAIIYTDDLGTRSENTEIPEDMKELAEENRTEIDRGGGGSRRGTDDEVPRR